MSKAAPPHAPAVLVVMESAGGLRAAASLRAALSGQADQASQAGLRVLSVAEIARKKQPPHVILTVSAVASREVSVAYWDLSGGRDVLSAPAPVRADQLDAVVLALASALLERHRPELLERRGGGAPAAVAIEERELARTTDALYAVLGRYAKLSPRSNVALRFEDF